METSFYFTSDSNSLLVQVVERGHLVYPTDGSWFGDVKHCPFEWQRAPEILELFNEI